MRILKFKKIQYFLTMLLFGAHINSFSADGSSKEKVKEETSPLKISVGANQYYGFKGDGLEPEDAPLTELYTSLSYQFSDNHKIQLLQVLLKKYEINAGESEVDVSDSALRHSWKFGELFWGISSSWRTEITVPLSETSQRNGLIISPEGRLYLSKDVGEILSVTLIPRMRYYVNKYTTTDTHEGANGGTPLRRMRLGGALDLTLNLSEKLSFTAYGTWDRIYYETGKVNLDSAAPLDNRSHTYLIDLSTSYSVTKNWSVGLGYVQNAGAESAGGVEIYAFDADVSQWYLSTSYKF